MPPGRYGNGAVSAEFAPLALVRGARRAGGACVVERCRCGEHAASGPGLGRVRAARGRVPSGGEQLQ